MTAAGSRLHLQDLDAPAELVDVDQLDPAEFDDTYLIKLGPWVTSVTVFVTRDQLEKIGVACISRAIMDGPDLNPPNDDELDEVMT